MYNPLMSFLKPQRFFGGGDSGGGGGSDSDDSSSSSSSGGGYTSIADMFDGGGAGGSGDSFYSGSHDDYVSSGGTGGVSHSSSNDDNDDPSPTPVVSTPTPVVSTPAPADTSSNSGYTSLIDMFDGGGAGGSGSEFYAGSHETYEDTAAGIADAASDAAGTTNYEGGTYTGATDMIDGGGPGQSGDTFEGPLSGISTGIGATPLGSGIEPTGVAGFVNSGGITGAVINAITGGGSSPAGGIDTLPAAGVTAQPGETSGYTGLTDMIDGGGPGQSGDEFGGALGGVSNALGLTPLGSGGDQDSGAEEGNSGYTSITDMIDGGGPGQSGDEFGGLLGPVSNAVGVTPLGSADEPGFLAGVSGYGYYDDAGNYVPATVDMIDGGGAGTSGDEFGGALGGVSNAVGATPYGSGIEPTGVAGVVNDAVTGTGNAIENIVDTAANTVSNIFNDNTTTDNSVVNNTYNTVPDTIQLLDPVSAPDYIEESPIGDYTTLSVGQPGGGTTNFDLVGVGQPGGIVNPPAGAMSYLPSEGLMALQNLYANAASQQAPTQQATFGFPGQQNLFPSLVLPQLNSPPQAPVVDPYGLFQFNQRLV